MANGEVVVIHLSDFLQHRYPSNDIRDQTESRDKHVGLRIPPLYLSVDLTLIGISGDETTEARKRLEMDLCYW